MTDPVHSPVELARDIDSTEQGWSLEEKALARALLEAEETLDDLEKHGLRCDLTPTMQFKDMTQIYGDMVAYLRRADERVRERARSSLSVLRGSE